jgi:transcriptional regulator with XRE-family HTH domain
MEDNIEPDVGSRLRSLRELQGLSLRALAERCGLSINAISQIERGENSPTISSLHRLAKALNVPITDLFLEDSRQTMVFIKKDLGLRAHSNGVVMESLGIGLVNQQLEPFRMVISAGAGNIDDPIAHSGEEFIYCLKGEVEYRVGSKLIHLEEGDSLLFDATQNHGYRNATAYPAIILLMFQATHDRQQVRQLHLDGKI